MTKELQPCLVHVGQTKTGTTSIQSTLFKSLRNQRYALVTLDSFFGNRLLMAAFTGGQSAGESVVLQPAPAKQRQMVCAAARDYLDRAITSARRRQAVPILSAEVIWRYFSERSMEHLRDFLEARGCRPHVIGYLRAPWDWIESSFQQSVRLGRPDPWSETVARFALPRAREVIGRLDRSFGRENVSLHVFDPAHFPGGCVVQHLCRELAIPLSPSHVVRENDSLNLHVLRFVHAYNTITGPEAHHWSEALVRTVLIEAMADADGPPLRLHEDVTANWLREFGEDQPWLRERLGREVPLTLAARKTGGGMKCHTELERFDDEAIDWLSRRLGRRVRPGTGIDGQRDVALALRRLLWCSPAAIARVLDAKVRLRVEREWRKRALAS